MVLWKGVSTHSLNFSLAEGNVKLQSCASQSYLYELSERLLQLASLESSRTLLGFSSLCLRLCVCLLCCGMPAMEVGRAWLWPEGEDGGQQVLRLCAGADVGCFLFPRCTC